jgi:hypothetical protein
MYSYSNLYWRVRGWGGAGGMPIAHPLPATNPYPAFHGTVQYNCEHFSPLTQWYLPGGGGRVDIYEYMTRFCRQMLRIIQK